MAQIASVLQTVPDQYVNEPDDDLKCAMSICVWMWFKTHCNMRSVENCSV